MTNSKPVLQIIIASIREGRVGKSVGEWVADQARAEGTFEVEVVDLAEVNLPLCNEPNHPRLQKYEHESTKQWSETISRGDAFIFVMPEYNYGYSAPLKNALDTIYVEWNNKPVGLVSYGGVSGGLRATSALRNTLQALQLFVPTEAVIIPMVASMVEDGKFKPSEEVAKSVGPLLAGIEKLRQATAVLRN